VLFCKFSGTDEEVVLIRNEGSVIVGKIYNFFGTLESNIKCLAISCESFFNLDALCIKLSLEGIYVLVVRFEVEKTHFIVLAISCQGLNHSLGDIGRSVHDN
jgi:hypothetical protein